MIESIDALLPELNKLNKPAVIVLDNASVHRAKAVKDKQIQWKQQSVRLLFLPPYCPLLPPYCPHLNKIETLWRMIKYQWLAPDAYQDFTTLCRASRAS